MTQHDPVTLAYTRALLELATAQNQADAVGDELRALGEVIASNRTFQIFLEEPAIGEGDRAPVLQHVFKPQVSPLLWNFISVLNVKRRLGLLAKIVVAYEDLLKEQQGKIDVQVTVAQALSDEQLNNVQQRVSQALNKHAILHQKVDDSIIGGMVLRIEDRLIDASVKQQLQTVRQRMLAAIPR